VEAEDVEDAQDRGGRVQKDEPPAIVLRSREREDRLDTTAVHERQLTEIEANLAPRQRRIEQRLLELRSRCQIELSDELEPNTVLHRRDLEVRHRTSPMNELDCLTTRKVRNQCPVCQVLNPNTGISLQVT